MTLAILLESMVVDSNSTRRRLEMAISADVMRSVTELGIASIQENPSAILVKVALKLNETYQYQKQILP